MGLIRNIFNIKKKVKLNKKNMYTFVFCNLTEN